MPRRRASVLATLILATLVAGCGGTSVTAPGATAPATSAPVTPAPDASSAAPDATDAAATEPPSATEPPAATEAPSATEPPTESAAPETTEPGASGSPGPGSVECSGSAENRDFFAAAAESVSWAVYCAVLPEGWFVDTGEYRLADGGRLAVTYRGPGDGSIELQEGAYCTTGASACSPRDHELGPAAFGDLTGMLVTLGPSEADGFAVYVDPGAAPSWAITGTGMDQATFTGIAAALTRVSP